MPPISAHDIPWLSVMFIARPRVTGRMMRHGNMLNLWEPT